MGMQTFSYFHMWPNLLYLFFQDKSSKPWKEKFKNDDGIELMIPAVNKDFLPEIIYTMIKDNKVDIEAEYVFKPVAYFISLFKIKY